MPASAGCAGGPLTDGRLLQERQQDLAPLLLCAMYAVDFQSAELNVGRQTCLMMDFDDLVTAPALHAKTRQIFAMCFAFGKTQRLYPTLLVFNFRDLCHGLSPLHKAQLRET